MFNKFIILSLLLLGACGKSAINSEIKENGIEVELIIEHNGCRVYRFYDGRKVYYTDCSSTTYQYDCGKNCVKNETVNNRD